VDGPPLSASLVRRGRPVPQSARLGRRAAARTSLPKLESHSRRGLWKGNDASRGQERLGSRGTLKGHGCDRDHTSPPFEMDEILLECAEHSACLKLAGTL